MTLTLFARLRLWSDMTNDPHTTDAKKLIEIQAEIDADPDLYLTKTDPLTPDDMLLTGRVVQIFNYADLNARRIIDAINHAAFGPAKQNGGILQDAQVYEKLISAAELLPEDTNLRNGLIKAASTLQMHHVIRHHFAHWAMRRIPGYDALFMMTYNSQEGERRNGKRTAPYEITYGVLPLASARAEVEKLEGHSKWLAGEAARLHTEFDRLKKHFDDEKAAEKAARYEAGKTKRGAKGPPKS